MSFVFTHAQMIAEGQLLGENVLEPQRAVIVGGNARVFEPREDADGTYVGDELVMCYPNMCSDSLVELSSVRVVANTALLRYFQGTATPVKGHANLVQVPADTGGKRGIEIGDTVFFGEKRVEIMAIAAEEVGAEGEEVEEVKVLVLSRNLTASQREAAAVEVVMCLPVHDVEFRSAVVSAEGVTLPADLKMMSPGWAGASRRCGEEPQPLRVVHADVSIVYTVWYSSHAGRVAVVETQEDLKYIVGEDVAENHLKKAVALAFANSGGMPVAYIAVADPNDLASWVTALSRVRGDYGIVPCSTRPGVTAAVEDLVEHRSRAESGRECVAWVYLTSPTIESVADDRNSNDLEALFATVIETPTGLVVDVPAGNARFMTLGVRSGDVLRYGAGGDVYEEFLIDAVVNEDSLTVQGDIPVANTPLKIEIWRRLDADGLAANIADRAGAFQSKRIRAVWSYRLRNAQEPLAGWNLCAALAGLRSGCAPQRSLAGVQIVGLEENYRRNVLDEDQLDMMAECGVWIVDQQDGVLVTQQGLTTADRGDVTAYDESVVTNLDSINKALRATLARTMQNTAATRRFRSHVVTRLRSTLGALARRHTATIGAQLVAGEIGVVRHHVYLEDSLVLNVKLTIPQPFGYGLGTPSLEVHQRVIA